MGINLNPNRSVAFQMEVRMVLLTLGESTNGINAKVANASINGAVLVLTKTFLSKVTNATSFARQISVIQTKKKTLVTSAVTVKNARISRFCAKMAKNKAK